MLKMSFLHRHTPSIIVIILSLFFAFTWLPTGKFIGGGDVGIPVLYPDRALKLVASPWWGKQEMGATVPTTYTAVPLYVFFTGLAKLGIGPAETQKLFIFLVLVTSGLSMLKLGSLWNLSSLNRFVLAIFYMSNPLALSVWHRGIHNSMLLLAFIPLSLLCLAWGVTKRKYSSLPIFSLLSILFSYVYGSPAFVITLWLLWGSYLFFSWSKNSSKFMLQFCILFVLAWIASVFWWLDHFLAIGKMVFSLFSDFELRQRSSEVVIALRDQNDPLYIIRLLNKFQYFDQSDWGKVFSTPIFTAISWLLPLIAFGTALSKQLRRNIVWKWTFGLSLLVIFISKGINAPFGWIARLLYDAIPKLAPLRNGYEKVGIILPFLFAILIAFALSKYKPVNKLIIGAVITVIFCWPIWTGKVFSGESAKALISIPNYYAQASNWIASQDPTSRIIHLPLAPGEAINYTWGYSGIEPSQLLFANPSISYATGYPAQDQIHAELLTAIHTQDTTYFTQLLSALNIRYLVLHNETDWRPRGSEPPDRIAGWLASFGSVHHAADFGPLSVYEIDVAPKKIYSASAIHYTSTFAASPQAYSWHRLTNLTDVVVDTKSNYALSEIYFPIRQLNYSSSDISVYKENALKELPYVRILPTNPLYPAIQVKEKLQRLTGKFDSETACLDLAGKRLVEAAKLDKANSPRTPEILDTYISQLTTCTIGPAQFNFWREYDPDKLIGVMGLLIRQEVVLKNEFTHFSSLPTQEKFRAYLVQIGATLAYPAQVATDSARLAVTFTLPKPGDYQLAIPDLPLQFMKDSPKLIQTNATAVLPAQSLSQVPTKITLREGASELHMLPAEYDTTVIVPKSPEPPANLSFKSGDKIDYKLSSLPQNLSYSISFDFLTLAGQPPQFKVLEDIFTQDLQGLPIYKIRDTIALSDYEHSWRHQQYTYTPSRSARSATITIEPVVWNNCIGFFPKYRCKDQFIARAFNRDSRILISNFTITPIANIHPVLTAANSHPSPLGSSDIKFTQLSSTKYAVTAVNQKPPYFIIFSEMFHPGWKLLDSAGKEIVADHIVANGFANAWQINEELPENVTIEFSASRPLLYGIIISALAISLLTIFAIWRDSSK